MEQSAEQPPAPVRLDLEGARLWRGAEALRLRPKSFAVLRSLMAQAGRVVCKEALLEAVWPDTAVSDGVLKVCLSELRRALGDTARAECTPLHRGRTTMVWQTRITRGDGKLAALVTQTQLVL